MPQVSPLAPKSCDHEVWETKLANNNLPDGWESRISWETATPGMALRPITPNYNPPPGLKWLPRMATNGKLYQTNSPPGTGGEPGGKGGPEGGPEVDNSMMGFFKRYWYIIVPMLIINLMGGEAPPPPAAEGGEGGSSSGGRGIAQGGAAPTAAPGGGSGGGGGANKKRRGKRD